MTFGLCPTWFKYFWTLLGLERNLYQLSKHLVTFHRVCWTFCCQLLSGSSWFWLLRERLVTCCCVKHSTHSTTPPPSHTHTHKATLSAVALLVIRGRGVRHFLKSRTPCLVKSEIKPVKSVFSCKLKRFPRKLKATWAEISWNQQKSGLKSWNLVRRRGCCTRRSARIFAGKPAVQINTRNKN